MNDSPMLEVNNLSVSYGLSEAVRNICFEVHSCQWLMIAGPNGAGKSTIINAITQAIPYSGMVLYNKKDVKKATPRNIALWLGVLSQSSHVGYPFTVEEVVRLGRYAYSKGFLSGHDKADDTAVDIAIASTGLTDMRQRTVTTLSGGELQRTFLAQVFAQNPKILLLDEPANHLDPVYQKQIFELVRDWMDNTKGAVISVVHDLSLAKKYGTHALLLKDGKQYAYGTVAESLTAQKLQSVYSMDISAWMRDLLSVWGD